MKWSEQMLVTLMSYSENTELGGKTRILLHMRQDSSIAHLAELFLTTVCEQNQLMILSLGFRLSGRQPIPWEHSLLFFETYSRILRFF